MNRHEQQMVYEATNELIPNTKAQADDPHLQLERIHRSRDYFNYAANIADKQPELAMELLKVLDMSGFLADKPFTGELKLIAAFRKSTEFLDLALKHNKLVYWK